MSSPTTPQPSVRKKATRQKKVQPKPPLWTMMVGIMLVVPVVLIPLWLCYVILSATNTWVDNKSRDLVTWAETTVHVNEIKNNRTAQAYVRIELSDPHAQFRNQVASCGEVNSKNRGYQKFVVINGVVMFEPRTGNITPFNQLWAANCR